MSQTFMIVPANLKPFWILIPAFLILIGVMILLGLTLAGSRTSSFEVGAFGLRIRGDLYGRTIPASQLHTDSARIVNIEQETAMKPRSRRVGTALPGYSSGWFRLANGEKALVYLTQRTRAVYIPTRAGYSLLLSPGDADGFLAAVKRL